MIELKVENISESLRVALSKDVIRKLHASDCGALFFTEAPDSGHQLTPGDHESDKKMSKAENIIGRYRNTLDVLVK